MRSSLDEEELKLLNSLDLSLNDVSKIVSKMILKEKSVLSQVELKKIMEHKRFLRKYIPFL